MDTRRYITNWLGINQAWVPNPENHHSDIPEGLLIDGDLRGNFVTDACLAALVIEYGIGICSFDSDFACFDGVCWIDPDRRQHHRLMPGTPPLTRSWGDTQWLSPVPRALVRQV